ncbi:ArsR family transcriptional regulator [Nonomuraea sp. NPDC049486]|uniref:ArsR family transcriptional regulator n=1 Tax=Nonomuraea sp. NPDC049486 TaxID=3155773 RepID=UPI003436D65A
MPRPAAGLSAPTISHHLKTLRTAGQAGLAGGYYLRRAESASSSSASFSRVSVHGSGVRV